MGREANPLTVGLIAPFSLTTEAAVVFADANLTTIALATGALAAMVAMVTTGVALGRLVAAAGGELVAADSG